MRHLVEYATPARRAVCLGAVIVTTTAVFYQLYLQGAVSPLIIADFGIPLSTYVLTSIIGNAVGAVAAWAAGLADRFGRVRLILAGSLAASILTGLVLPAMTSAPAYVAAYAVLSLVGGVCLVPSSALVRDFSPQAGRATAMALSALGPSIGSLLISLVTARMLPDHPTWQFHFRVAGAIGAVVFVMGLLLLRELSPGLPVKWS